MPTETPKFMIEFGRTNRGFTLGQFRDWYDAECSIQKSSLASTDAIWLGIDDADPKIMASVARQYGIKTEETTGWDPYPIPDAVSLTTRMHLTREMAAALIPLLQHFVDNGELPPAPKGD